MLNIVSKKRQYACYLKIYMIQVTFLSTLVFSNQVYTQLIMTFLPLKLFGSTVCLHEIYY